MKNGTAKRLVNKRYKVVKKEYLSEKSQGIKEGIALTGGILLFGCAILPILYLYIQKYHTTISYITGIIVMLSLVSSPSIFYNIMKNKYDKNYINIKNEKKLLENLKKELENNKNRLNNVKEKDFDVAIKKLVNNN